MGRKISEIYSEYKIMPSLQDHMFRVAAVASMICDNFSESLPKEEIVTACLLHDMGNIIKSRLEYFPDFLEPEGLAYWQKVKDDFIKKYGEDEEAAHVEIMKEVQVSIGVISLVNKISFSNAMSHRDSDDFTVKIINYCDWRVGPHGVVSFDERMAEARIRYKWGSQPEDKNREVLVGYGKEVEKQIFAKCKIKPEDINDKTAAPVISTLRDFIILSK